MEKEMEKGFRDYKGLYSGYIGVIFGFYWGYIWVLLGLPWVHIGIMENKMEATIMGYIRLILGLYRDNGP